MEAVPIPPAPQLGAVTAYSLAAGLVLAGLVITFFGCRLHYLLAALVGAGTGFALTPVAQKYIAINPLYVQIGLVLILAALLAVASRVTWAAAAGAIGAAVAATALLVSQIGNIPVEASLTAWWKSVPPTVFAMGTINWIWQQQQGLVLMVMFSATVLPVLLGVFFNRAIMVLVTALIGATATVAGLVVGLAQIKDRLWPENWMDVAVLGLATVVITLIGAVCQCLFAQRRKAAEDQEKG